MKDCCNDDKNRVVISATCEQCKVCGAKHYTLEVEPVRMGIKGGEVR